MHKDNQRAIPAETKKKEKKKRQQSSPKKLFYPLISDWAEVN